jgi:hypothetical protein
MTRQSGVADTVKTKFYCALAMAALLACATPASAQSAAGLAVDPNAMPADPQTLALARTLVAKTNTGDIVSLGWLGFPMARLMGQMGIVKPDQSKAVMHEVILPVLTQHKDALADIQARTYAAIMTPDDLKAAIAFYSTPAGQHLIAIHAPLLQLNLAAVTQLLETLKPEIQQKAQATLKSHGWTNG